MCARSVSTPDFEVLSVYNTRERKFNEIIVNQKLFLLFFTIIYFNLCFVLRGGKNQFTPLLFPVKTFVLIRWRVVTRKQPGKCRITGWARSTSGSAAPPPPHQSRTSLPVNDNSGNVFRNVQRRNTGSPVLIRNGTPEFYAQSIRAMSLGFRVRRCWRDGHTYIYIYNDKRKRSTRPSSLTFGQKRFGNDKRPEIGHNGRRTLN